MRLSESHDNGIIERIAVTRMHLHHRLRKKKALIPHEVDASVQFDKPLTSLFLLPFQPLYTY